MTLPRASGPRDIPIALCQALANHYKVPFSRDNVRDEVESLLQQQAHLNVLNVGQLLSNLDLSVSLVGIPAASCRESQHPPYWNTREVWSFLKAWKQTVGCGSWIQNSGRCASLYWIC